MFKYAQTDENGVVIGISFLSGAVAADNLFLLDNVDNGGDVHLGWRLAGGQWVEPEYVPAEIVGELPEENQANGIADLNREPIDGEWNEPAPEPESTAAVEELKEFMLLNMQLTLEALEQINEMKGGAEDV